MLSDLRSLPSGDIEHAPRVVSATGDNLVALLPTLSAARRVVSVKDVLCSSIQTEQDPDAGTLPCLVFVHWHQLRKFSPEQY